MHVIDAVLKSFSNLFRSHRYSHLEKIYSVVLFTASLSIRETKEGTKRFYKNMNSKRLKSIEEIATAVAIVHNLVRTGEIGGGEVIPT